MIEAVNREYSAGGLADRKGNVLIGDDELGGVDFMAKLLNLGESTKVTNMYTTRSAIRDAEYARRDFRSRLMREYTRARVDGDRAEMAEKMAEIEAFNRRNPAEVRISPRHLMAAFREENSRQGQLRSGVRIRRSNADLAEEYGLGE
jgi:hypothetical protein